MDNIILIIGYLGVLCFIISYLQKKRKGIIAFTFAARVFFVTHYVLLGGYAGAVQNGVGGVASIISYLRGKRFFNSKFMPVLIFLLTLAGGVLTYDSTRGIVSVFPVVAMLIQNTALWLKNQTYIRILTLAGIPIWFVYNFSCGSLPAMTSDTLSAISLIVSLVRYDIIPRVKLKN
ncbi:MAG: YgjV family protein [Clostridia bacterium]|nr:YgjV family protein [Clostridia bacterium]